MTPDNGDYSTLPHLAALEEYRDGGHAYPFGSFLTAVLANDLVEAAHRADSTNIRLLPNYASFLYNEMPHRTGDSSTDSWGSYEAVGNTIARRSEAVR